MEDYPFDSNSEGVVTTILPGLSAYMDSDDSRSISPPPYELLSDVDDDIM